MESESGRANSVQCQLILPVSVCIFHARKKRKHMLMLIAAALVFGAGSSAVAADKKYKNPYL